MSKTSHYTQLLKCLYIFICIVYLYDFFFFFFFFSSRRRHTRLVSDWSSDVCSSDLTEFMCHPGFCTNELQGARTRLKESRRQELDALTSAEVRKAIEESSVKLVSYRDL